MTPDVSWMQNQFNAFNRAYFEGKLPLPRLALSKSRTRLGTMSCKRTFSWKGTQLTDFTIALSVYYDLTERQAQNVLLHEMIHYAIAYHGWRDTAPHGTLFRRLMAHLNETHGWEISISTSTKDFKLAPGNAPSKRNAERTRLVLALTFTDGKHFLSVVNPAYARAIDKALRRVPQLESHGWYQSTSPFFAAYPVVRTPKARRVSAQVFAEQVGKMTKVEL